MNSTSSGVSDMPLLRRCVSGRRAVLYREIYVGDADAASWAERNAMEKSMIALWEGPALIRSWQWNRY